MGFGIDEPVTAALVDEIVDFFTTEANPDALIHIAPALLPDDWPAICERHGIRPSVWCLGTSLTLMSRDIADTYGAPLGSRVR